MSFQVVAKSTSFFLSTNDIRDQKLRAEVAAIRATTRKTQIESGELTAQQALNVAVDAKDAPREFLPQDLTAGGSLDDNEKIASETSQVIQGMTPAAALPAVSGPLNAPQPIVKPALLPVTKSIDSELDEALALVEEILSRALPATADADHS